MPTGRQHFDTLKGLVARLLLLLGRAVTVVEHRAEQRCGCSHAGTALGQRQRGVLVDQQRSQALVGQL